MKAKSKTNNTDNFSKSSAASVKKAKKSNKTLLSFGDDDTWLFFPPNAGWSMSSVASRIGHLRCYAIITQPRLLVHLNILISMPGKSYVLFE